MLESERPKDSSENLTPLERKQKVWKIFRRIPPPLTDKDHMIALESLFEDVDKAFETARRELKKLKGEDVEIDEETPTRSFERTSIGMRRNSHMLEQHMKDLIGVLTPADIPSGFIALFLHKFEDEYVDGVEEKELTSPDYFLHSLVGQGSDQNDLGIFDSLKKKKIIRKEYRKEMIRFTSFLSGFPPDFLERERRDHRFSPYNHHAELLNQLRLDFREKFDEEIE